jgi:hypothetical protein
MPAMIKGLIYRILMRSESMCNCYNEMVLKDGGKIIAEMY